MTSPVSEGTGRWYVLRVRRYLLAGFGPVTLAATHFAISFAMLRLDKPAAFGVFTFLFVAAQFTVALSTALFGAPLQALPTSSAPIDRDGTVRAISAAAMLMAAVAGACFFVLAIAMGLPALAASAYGVYTAIMILRWLGRAWSYAADRAGRAALSDVSYGIVTLAAFGLAANVLRIVPSSACYCALALGAAASLLAFGRSYAALLLNRPRRTYFQMYGAIWRSQSRWALLGVATTEVVANVHIYMVTLVAGPSAVAPLAAVALLLRPINVVQNALVEFERPQMARLIANGAGGELKRTMRLFLGVLLAAWIASSLIAVVLLRVAPTLVFSDAYDLGTVNLATASWLVVTLLVLLQVPANVMLQAAGDFQGLARVTIWSSAVSVLAVATTLLLVGPSWTIAAMALGWLVDLTLVRRAARKRLQSFGLLDTGGVSRL